MDIPILKMTAAGLPALTLSLILAQLRPQG